MGLQNNFTAVTDGFNIGTLGDNQLQSVAINYGANVQVINAPINSDTGQVLLVQNVTVASGNANGSVIFRLPPNSRIHSCYLDITGATPLTGGTYAMYVQNSIAPSPAPAPTVVTIQAPASLPTTIGRYTVLFSATGSAQVLNIGTNIYVRFDWASVAPTTVPLGITMSYSVVPVNIPVVNP